MAKCTLCAENSHLVPICKKGTKYYDDESDLARNRYVCGDCLQDNDEYIQCPLCKGVAYHIDDLIEYDDGYACSEHIEDLSYSDEEAEDIDSFIEYLSKE